MGKNAMKQNKCDCKCEMPVMSSKASSSAAAHGFAYHARTLTSHHSLVLNSSLRSSLWILEQKRDCSQSMSLTKKFAFNNREQLFHY